MILTFPHQTALVTNLKLNALVMLDTDSSSEDSHSEDNPRRVNNLVMPNTNLEFSADDTPNQPSSPNETRCSLAMPETDSDYSEAGETETRAMPAEILVDPRLVMPNFDSLSNSSASSDSSAVSDKHLKVLVEPNLQFRDIDNMSGSESSLF